MMDANAWRGIAIVLAGAVVALVILLGAIEAKSDRRHDDYRQLVNLCATTADTPAEFRACVEVAE